MNWFAVKAIFHQELARMWRTFFQTLATPVITTSLFLIVFGSTLGNRMQSFGDIPYAAFIVPGIVILSVLTESVSNTAFGIYMPRYSGAIYEIFSAPLSTLEILLGYVGAAATKSLIIAAVIMITAALVVDYHIVHPIWMVLILSLTALTFCLMGFLIGLWASGWEKLQVVPALLITPLTFLGGCFYSIETLPSHWQVVALFNPMVYVVSAFRWSFYDQSDVGIGWCLALLITLTMAQILLVHVLLKSGYRLKP